MRLKSIPPFLLLACLSVQAAVPSVACAAPKEPAPRLIVQLTVDQLRGDMLPRYRDRFGANGFRRLTDRGLYYTNAHYGTGNTFTAAGHAVLVTGADTAEHGMVANEWFDRASAKGMYATFDPQHGQSPVNLTSTTIGDELLSAHERSRAFAIAGKDRSAIIPGGHRGKAFWFSDSDGGFRSSTYYYEALPTWVQAWNDRKPIEKYRGLKWTLLLDPARYLNTANAANTYARPNPGVTFPHVIAAADDKAFIRDFRTTPFLDEHTLNFAQELIRSARLGQGATPDYFSISLSGTDYIGHAYGPNSLEYEDGLLRLDTLLASFLAFLDATVGPSGYLIVLSADHGVDDIPEVHKAHAYDAERFQPKLLLEQMNAALKRRFNTSDDLIAAFAPPGFYLKTVPDSPYCHIDPQLTCEAIETALADNLRKVPGVAYAYTHSDLLAGRVPDTALGRKIARSYHPTRSGDVVIVQKQFWYLYHDSECCAAMHGSPYSYDTFVPVIFYGTRIPARRVVRPVEPASIAPTLAALLKIKPPSGNSAEPLVEVLDY